MIVGQDDPYGPVPRRHPAISILNEAVSRHPATLLRAAQSRFRGSHVFDLWEITHSTPAQVATPRDARRYVVVRSGTAAFSGWRFPPLRSRLA
jgi:hypothetical protein